IVHLSEEPLIFVTFCRILARSEKGAKMRKLFIACLLLSGNVYAQNVTDTFRFTTDYYFLDLQGNVGQRQQIVGTYIRDFSSKKVKWTNITTANSANDSSDRLLPPEKR